MEAKDHGCKTGISRLPFSAHASVSSHWLTLLLCSSLWAYGNWGCSGLSVLHISQSCWKSCIRSWVYSYYHLFPPSHELDILTSVFPSRYYYCCCHCCCVYCYDYHHDSQFVRLANWNWGRFKNLFKATQLRKGEVRTWTLITGLQTQALLPPAMLQEWVFHELYSTKYTNL